MMPNVKRSNDLRGPFFSWVLSLSFFLLGSPVFPNGAVPTLETTPAATPSDIPKTDLGPDLSAVDLSYDTRAFFQRASGLYYDYNQRGLKQFRCQVDDDGWDQILRVFLLEEAGRQRDEGENGELGSETTSKKLKNLKFFITYTHEDGFKFSREDFTASGNPEYDKLADRMTALVGNEVLLFTNAWDGILEMKKPTKKKPEYKVVKGPKGYTVSEIRDGQTWVWLFQENGLLSESWTPSVLINGGKLHLGFSFEKAKDGYLPTVITFETGDGEVSGVVHVEYEDAGNFKLPKRVWWKCEYPGKEKTDKDSTGDSLAFFKYQVNETPVESPLSLQPSRDILYLMQQGFNEAVHAGFEVHVGFGPFLSDNPPVNRYSGYNGAFGMGWEINRSFSLSLEFQGADYKTRDEINDLYFTELMALGKYRFFTGDFRPFVSVGMGVGISEYFPNMDFKNMIAHDTNFVAEAGLGLEVQVAKNFFLLAQTSAIDHQLSPSFSQVTGVENPFQFVPLQFGVVFER